MEWNGREDRIACLLALVGLTWNGMERYGGLQLERCAPVCKRRSTETDVRQSGVCGDAREGIGIGRMMTRLTVISSVVNGRKEKQQRVQIPKTEEKRKDEETQLAHTAYSKPNYASGGLPKK
ncbi:hypothetical protein GALMADRAFT_761254 [Galerina marginata CBS 339.88]|uniref:Uncharacterized protein n=1 Tax=Galerina marginata (strain CBS 339.88) TaxID=685588 RepID=A0A067T0Y8_GALM3|nr:hypothetical protein GALMADRAFT_761254 [Galerina marginata CBS 339.88]